MLVSSSIAGEALDVSMSLQSFSFCCSLEVVGQVYLVQSSIGVCGGCVVLIVRVVEMVGHHAAADHH